MLLKQLETDLEQEPNQNVNHTHCGMKTITKMPDNKSGKLRRCDLSLRGVSVSSLRNALIFLYVCLCVCLWKVNIFICTRSTRNTQKNARIRFDIAENLR